MEYYDLFRYEVLLEDKKEVSSMPCWFIIRISGSFPLIGADMLT
jgi:hypothetical protein